MVLFDLTDKNSFKNVAKWIEDVKKLNSDDPVFVVLGNKSDELNKEVNESDLKVKCLII